MIPHTRELARIKKDTDTKVEITLEGAPEAVRRILRLLACIEYNGSVGHSGLFGISWDGDGADRIRIKGLPKDIDRKQFGAMSNYSSILEYVGEGEKCYITKIDRDTGTPTNIRVWPEKTET